MKILLDESLPRKLRDDFGNEHDVWTVRDKGWLGKKNGELLKLMINSGFELFITLVDFTAANSSENNWLSS